MPGSLAARRLQLTLQDPCRLPAWSGRTIHMACRTYCAPMHSHNPSQGTDQGPHCNFGFWPQGTCPKSRFLPPWTQGPNKKGWSGAPSAQQGLLHAILIQYPTTASSVQFCLLCCQPEPMPGSLAARRLQLTLQDPCRLPAWSGRTIHMACRTYCAPMHSHNPSQGTDQGPHCSL